MSGCQPTGDFCNCNCHKIPNSIACSLCDHSKGQYVSISCKHGFLLDSGCEECHKETYIEIPKNNEQMMYHIQELERQLDNLRKDYVPLHTLGSPVLVESIKHLENRLKELEDFNSEFKSTALSEIKSAGAEYLKLIERIDKLESNGNYNKDYGLALHKLQIIMLERLEKLESLVDVNKIEQIILDGANLHATILKFEARMKIADQTSKKPHRCPICEGYGVKFDAHLKLDGLNSICKSCEGKGVLWA